MLACPRCHLMLFVAQAGGVFMHACGRCGGVWLDQHGSERIRKTACADMLRLAHSASASAAAQIDTAALLGCPVCRGPLARTRIPSAWLDVDVCAAHGTWFDRDELARVARALSLPAPGDWRHQPHTPPAAAPHADDDEDEDEEHAAVGFAVMEALLDFAVD